MYHKNKAYRRSQRHKAIERKKQIIQQVYQCKYCGVEGKLNKGKVHCSCPLCTRKTAQIGYKASDRRKLNKLKEEFKNIDKVDKKSTF